MTDGPQPAVPQLRVPDMEVGFNYPWAFNRYGTWIGPRDIEHDPPTGVGDDLPVWRDTKADPPAGTLARNLETLKSTLHIKKVRVFLLCNAFNYGPRPVSNVTPSGKSFFTAPASLHPQFLDHFKQMLEVFQSKGMQILPSLLDFGAIYPMKGSGGGRTSIATSQRARFLETVVAPFVEVSKNFRETVFAWEAINEPHWNIIAAYGFSRPHTPDSGPDLAPDVMASFIGDMLRIFEGAGFASTVGHRFFANLTDKVLPAGTRPQFHYYALRSVLPNLVTPYQTDPDSIPKFDAGTNNSFVGEIASKVDRPWPDCQGADSSARTATFERLKVLARKGYKLAFVWPDRDDQGTIEHDELKLTADAQASIKDFTAGLFPNGMP